MTPAGTRGQANLAALGVALVVLVSVTGLSLFLADDALADADRRPLERRAATAVADELVAASSPTTVREQVLDRAAVANLSRRNLTRLAPVVDGHAVRVRLDGETVLDYGSPTGGTTVRRVVLVGTPEERTRQVDFGTSESLRLRGRPSRVRVVVRPKNATVRSVRLNDRVVLTNDSGINGSAQFHAGGRPNATVRFAASGGNGTGYALVTATETNTTASTLEVTVDA